MQRERPSIYLDHSATTPVWPEVLEAMQPYFLECYGNPSSIHGAGRRAHAGLQSARARIAELIDASPREIVFTGCGSESNNAALRGIGLARKAQTGANRIITSPVEHHAILETLEDLKELHGFAIEMLPVDSHGLVHADDLASRLGEDVALVSVMYANNEVGTVQPLAQLGEICRRHAVPFHSDAVQAMGKLPVNVDHLGVDALSASAHKFHGPKGVGFLYLRQNTPYRPFLTGGGHEGGRRAGTENVPLIVGMATALEHNLQHAQADWERMAALRDRLAEGVLTRVEGACLTGHPSRRLPHHASFILRGLEAEPVLIGLDMAGVMASSGSACTSGAQQPSHVLSSMGIHPPDSYGALRFSLGHGTREADVRFAVERLADITARLQGARPIV